MKALETNSPPPLELAPPSDPELKSTRPYFWLTLLIFGYIGVYLCRRNLAVAIPLLQEHFQATRGEIGLIASYSTVAYALGKFCFGVVVDRVGARTGFLMSLMLVGVMGLAGGLAPSLGFLAVAYSLNRFAGAAGWPSMVKMTPSWFGRKKLPFAIALLSLSYVAGGGFASLFAGLVAEWSGNNWRAIMAIPSLVLLGFWMVLFYFLPKENSIGTPSPAGPKTSFSLSELLVLSRIRQFWILCSLSFGLTLLRETFGTWLVDFIRTQGGPTVSNKVAAFLSTPFDLCGALGILAVGWIYGRIGNRARVWLLSAMLTTLALMLYIIPSLFSLGLWAVTLGLALIGFLTYGPYSLLAGTLALEIRGQKSAATVSGFVDGVGYIAGILAGAQFGKLVDTSGYVRGFELLAGLALISAVLCWFLYSRESLAEPEAKSVTS